jgi:hypothetical protein
MEKGSFASLLSGRVSSFLLRKQSLGLRTGMDVVENWNISLYLRSEHGVRGMSVSGMGVVQKRHVCLHSGHGARGMCLCLRSGAVQKRNVSMSLVLT